MELNGRRTFGPHAPNPITFTDIYHWSRLTERTPMPWEVKAICQMDNALIVKMRRDADREKEGGSKLTYDTRDPAQVNALKSRLTAAATSGRPSRTKPPPRPRK